MLPNLKRTGSFGLLLFVAATIITLVSCEKEVDINLGEGQERLVVEGSIETGMPPYVVLTKSVGYFSKLDLTTLQNSFVHGAQVSVSDGAVTAQLQEYTISPLPGISLSYYTVDTTGGNWMKGIENKTYTLNIKYDGQVYEARTKIPAPTPLDSLVTALPSFVREDNPDARQLKVYFKDPDTPGNYMRYYTKRNNEQYFAGLNSVYPDEIINGKQFETELPLGEDRNRPEMNFDSLGYAYPGDTVTLKWCAIDKETYNFWSTFEYAIGTIGSPFASPIRVKTNISNNALGIWGGYGTLYYTIVIKK